jgi:hypothetical protein
MSRREPFSFAASASTQLSTTQQAPYTAGLTPFAERHLLIDPESTDGKKATHELQKVLAKMQKTIPFEISTQVSIHLSAETTPSAYVTMSEPGHASIVISRGLINSIIENESELAFCIAHELRHVWFRERYRQTSAHGRMIKNSKVEEYCADVAETAAWLEEAGYAPGAGLLLLDKLVQITDSPQLLRPWIAATDVHGLGVNRSKAYAASLAALDQKGSYRKLDDIDREHRFISAELQEIALFANHTSHVQALIQSPRYQAATADEKFELLFNEIKNTTGETVTARKQEFENALGAIAEKVTDHREKIERLFEFLITAPQFEVVSMCQSFARQHKLLPERLLKLRTEAQTFLAPPKDPQKWLNSCRFIREIRQTLGGATLNLELLGISSKEARITEHIDKVESSFRQYEPGTNGHTWGLETLRSLWYLGVHKESMILPTLPNNEVESWLSLPRLIDNSTELLCFKKAVARSELERQVQKVIAESQRATDQPYEPLQLLSDQITPPIFIQHFYRILNDNRHVLETKNIPADLLGSTIEEIPDDEKGDSLREHLQASQKLVKLLVSMEQQAGADPRAKELFRGFFLGHHPLSFTSLIGGTSVFSPLAKQLTHPFTQLIISSQWLSPQEKLPFTLEVEERLPLPRLRAIYFGKQKFERFEDKLEHLLQIGAHYQGAKKLAEEMLLNFCLEHPPGTVSLVPILSRFGTLFVGLRLAESDKIASLIEHVQALEIPATLSTFETIKIFKTLESCRLFPIAEGRTESDLKAQLHSRIFHDLQNSGKQSPETKRALAEAVLYASEGSNGSITDFREKLEDTFGEHASAATVSFNQQRAKAFRMLSASGAINTIQDARLRAAATNLWIEAIREQIGTAVQAAAPCASTLAKQGLDENSTAYYTVTEPILLEVVKDCRARVAAADRLPLVAQLADHLELQHNLATMLRDEMLAVTPEQIQETSEGITAAELTLEFLAQSAKGRRGCIEFLTTPISAESIARFGDATDVFGERDRLAIDMGMGQVRKELLAELVQKTRTVRETIEALSKNYKIISLIRDEELGTVLSDRFEELAKTSSRLKADFELDNFEEPAKTSFHLKRDLEVYDTPARIFGLQLGATTKQAEAIKFAIVGLRIFLEDLSLAPLLQCDDVTLKNAFLQRLTAILEEHIEPEQLPVMIEWIRPGSDRLITLIQNEWLRFKGQKANQDLAEETLSSDLCNIFCAAVFDGLFRRTEDSVNAQHATSIENKYLALCTTKADELIPTLRDLVSRFDFKSIEELQDGSEIYQKHLDWSSRSIDPIALESAIQAFDLDTLRLHLQKLLALESHLEELTGEIPQLFDNKLAPLQPQSCFSNIKEYREDLSKALYKRTDVETIVWTAEFRQELLSLAEQHIQAARTTLSQSANYRETQFARELYDLYWSRGPIIRTALLEMLLLSADQQYQDRRGESKHFEEAFIFVTERVFPVGSEYAQEAKAILRAFLAESEPNSRSYLLSALMATAQDVSTKTEQISCARRIAQIMAMLGPAEKKLAQAINSHPSTPEELRIETAHVKGCVDPLPRWELTALFQRVVPQNYRNGVINRLGKDLGGASYYVTVQVDEDVLTLLRPHAVSKATSGLKRMQRVGEQMRTSPELAAMAEPFSESIRQTQEMITTETDHRSGIAQTHLAWKAYNGMQIEVKSGELAFNVTLSTAQWLAAGPGFRHQKQCLGVHFNDLPENTPAEFARKKAIAAAYLAVEFSKLLSGQCFDHDRHGMQLKVQILKNGDVHLGLFDHGCMATTPFTEVEKKELAHSCCELFKRFLNKESNILTHAHAQIRSARENAKDGKSPHHLISFERALLALNDFMGLRNDGTSKYFSENEIASIFASVLALGEVDPIYADTMISELGSNQKGLPARAINLYKAVKKSWVLPSALSEMACKQIAEHLTERFASPELSLLISPSKEENHPHIIEFHESLGQ